MQKKRRSTGNPTLADVADVAGVSAITVSRALRVPGQVSKDTRARIDEAIRQLDYHPDPVAKALASAQSEIIGVLIPSVTNNAFADTIRGIYDVSEPSKYSVQLANTRYTPAQEERLLRSFLRQRPAGLIVSGIDQSPEVLDLLRNASCPVVQIFETGPDPIDMMVGFSHYDAATAGARHLLDMGYRRIGFIGARMDPRAKRRLEGLSNTLAQAGLLEPKRMVTTGQRSTPTEGGLLLSRLFEAAPDTDAVLCNNDDIALGVLFEAQRRGLSIPGEFGICGFNDMDVSSQTNPTLTSVRTPRRQVGRRAVEMLIARLNGSTASPCEDLGFEVIPRQSTALKSGASGGR